MEAEEADPYAGRPAEWGPVWGPVPGGGTAGPVDAVAAACAGCGEPVGWADREWRVVTRWPGQVAVEPVGTAWHRRCRRRDAWQSLGAAVAGARRGGADVGRALVPVVGALVAAAVPVVASVAAVAAERGRAVGEAAATLAGVVAEDARRGLRGVPLERVARPVGHGLGVALAVALDAGGRAARVVERARFEFADSAAEARAAGKDVWAGRVGWPGAWRRLRDHWWLRSEQRRRPDWRGGLVAEPDPADIGGDPAAITAIVGWLGRPPGGEAAAAGTAAADPAATFDGPAGPLWDGGDDTPRKYRRVEINWPDGFFGGRGPADGR